MNRFTDVKEIKALQEKNTIDKINNQIEDSNNLGKTNYNDDRFWKLTVDKSGNGGAIIRFLPSLDENFAPWVKYFSYHFQNSANGLYYIEWSRRSLPPELGNRDPCAEFNNYLYSTKKKEDAERAADQRRNVNYVSNILVVQDKAAPENEGKVFMFRYGPKIFEKLASQSSPDVDLIEKINIFDYFEGCNFVLIAKNSNNQRNYDSSYFKPASRLGTDERIVEVANLQYDLQEYVDPKHFKSYEQLKERLDLVLSSAPTVSADSADIRNRRNNTEYEMPEDDDLPAQDEEVVTVGRNELPFDDDEADSPLPNDPWALAKAAQREDEED